MTQTTPIIVAIVGAAVGIGSLLRVMLRVLAGTITRESAATNKRIDDLRTDINTRIDGLERTLDKRIDDTKNDLASRIDDTNRNLGALRIETQQGFEQVNRELGEHRERMAKLEGSLDGFLAGRRDRDAA